MDQVFQPKGSLRRRPYPGMPKFFLVIGLVCSCFAFPRSVHLHKPASPVRDLRGVPLIGVSVKLKGGQAGTQTDANGKYSIRVLGPGSVLTFSYIGFVSKYVTVKENTLDVILEDNSQGINEVLVIGYGQQKKATLTGAIAQVNAQEIMKSPTVNANNSLIGRLPGLQAVQTSGQPGADGATLKIRGAATFNDASAIVVVDGIERPGFNDVDPNKIETITVLKDAAATAIYGIRGANGVIVVTTKVGKIGKPRVTYTGNYALQTYTGIANGLNAYDNASLLNQAYRNNGQTAPFTDDELRKFKDGSDPYGYPDVQWFNYLTKKFYSQTQHNINISGGTKVAKYFV